MVIYTRALLITNLDYKHGVCGWMQEPSWRTSRSSLLQSLSLAYREQLQAEVLAWPSVPAEAGTAPAHSLPEPTNHPPLAPWSCQEAPLERCHTALRCAHHGASHRSLLSIGLQAFCFLSHLPPQVESSPPRFWDKGQCHRADRQEGRAGQPSQATGNSAESSSPFEATASWATLQEEVSFHRRGDWAQK